MVGHENQIESACRLYFLEQLLEITLKHGLIGAKSIRNGDLIKNQQKNFFREKYFGGPKKQIETVYRLYFLEQLLEIT